MRQFRLAPAAIALALIAVLCHTTARATTLVSISDSDLAVSVRAIVEGRVVGTESVWDPSRRAVFSYVTVDVERTHKGDVALGLVVLRQLGGEDGDHVTIVFGAPQFEPGQRVVLFLNADLDGALHVAHLSLGEFLVRTDPATGEELVVRAGNDDVDVLPGHGPATDVARRDVFLSSVSRSLVERADDVAHYDAKYAGEKLRLTPPEYTPTHAKGVGRTAFRFLGNGFRWFEFDSKTSIPVKVNPVDAPTPNGGFDEVKRALEAWSGITGASVRLKFAGKTKVEGLIADTVNSVAFGDPLQQIDDPVNCSGIVAQSGITNALAESVTVNGKVFQRIAEGDIVFNNGFDCLLANATVLGEALTHELGHVLGLGHSSERISEADPLLKDATMFFAIHNDGRGAAVRADDSEGIRFAYPASNESDLVIRTTGIADAVPGEAFEFSVSAKGGSSPYSWSLSAGQLPAGISLSETGRVFGTPTVEQTATFMLRVVDNDGSVVEQPLALTVTRTPAPFLTKAVYNTAQEKLVVTGRHLDTSASFVVNGNTLSVTPRLGRPVGLDSRLSVKGSENALRLKPRGSNVITVTIDGQTSNALPF
jgi:hypothetical protein